jgi:F0F1-type ATP synthase assembly protein I
MLMNDEDRRAYTHPYSIAAFAVLAVLILGLAIATIVALTTGFLPWYFFAIPLIGAIGASTYVILTTPKRFRNARKWRKVDDEEQDKPQ